jgi:simple sugar transport system permease protein
VVGIGFVSLFFGGLASAALYLPIMAGLPSSAIDIVNAAIALFITARSAWVDRLLRLGNAPS